MSISPTVWGGQSDRSRGTLVYAVVTIEKLPVEAMVDPSTSAMIISFDHFKKIGQQAYIPREELLLPDITLRDYNQTLIPIGARGQPTRKTATLTCPLLSSTRANPYGE